MNRSSFPWREWLLFLIFIGSLALATVPGLYLMGMHDMDPQEFEKNTSHLLGVQEDVAINLDEGLIAKAQEMNLDEGSLAMAIMASNWSQKYFGKNISVGILYAIDQAEWRGGNFPGDCDGVTASMGNKNVSGSAQQKAALEILAHWKEYDIRSSDPKAAEQVYPDYSGYKGGCSTGEMGSGFIPETARRVLIAVAASGDPTVADWNLWKHETTAKATAYEVGRMCPNGVNVNCLFGWNQNGEYRERLIATAQKVDAALAGSDLATGTWSETVYTGQGDDELWKQIVIVYLDLWGITPARVKSAPSTPPFNLANGSSLYFLYGHMDTVSVTPGQSVKKGDLIGICGNTGSSTGPHVHFGAADTSPDAFTTYLQFNPGWFDPKKVLGKEGFLASPISLTDLVASDQLAIGQDWMNIHELNPQGHPALDIPCVVGSQLYAIADSMVITTSSSFWTSGFGNTVVLKVSFESPNAPDAPANVAFGGWANPYPGSYVCGNAYGKVYPTGTHWGIDLCNGGQPDWVYAMHSGTVVYAQYLDRATSQAAEWWVSGNTIAIEGTLADGRKVWTCYGHGSDNTFKVSVGQTVQAGDPIMLSGSTGYSSGVHVHLCMKIDGSWVNPTQYFNETTQNGGN